MTANEFSIVLSPLDEQRFGISAARASGVTSEHIADALDFCRDHNVTFLVARSRAADLTAAQAMERNGFLLMDTLVYWARDLTKAPIPPDENSVPIRPAFPADAAQVRAVAIGSFRGYLGHYHADSRLDRSLCDETYTSWAERSVLSKEVADEVLVAELDRDIVGFATLRMNSADEGEGVLFGVSPTAQGRGIYRSFMLRGMMWCAEQGADHMVVSTQVTNFAVQRVWARLGFELSDVYYTFHKWFDEQ